MSVWIRFQPLIPLVIFLAGCAQLAQDDKIPKLKAQIEATKYELQLREERLAEYDKRLEAARVHHSLLPIHFFDEKREEENAILKLKVKMREFEEEIKALQPNSN